MNILKGRFSIEVAELGTFEVSLSMGAFFLLNRSFGVELQKISDFVNADPLGSLCTIAFCGIKNAALMSGQTPPLKDSEFERFSVLLLSEPKNIELISEAITAAFPDDEGEDSLGND